MPKVNPKILKWARETAGLSLEQAVKKISLNSARGVAAVDRLRALEAGEDSPSRPMLVRMAKQYRRPLLAFYLGEPPKKSKSGQDFRTLPKGHLPKDEPILDALLRNIRARQAIVRSAMEDDEDLQMLDWVGSLHRAANPKATAERIRNQLKFDINDFRAKKAPIEAFKTLREAAESQGAFVLLVGDLGSHHTAIEVQTFRGFSLADKIAPFIVINDRDSQAAWSFSLVHELTHIFLGQTGVSGALGTSSIERFCNDVASQVLLPDGELHTIRFDPWPGNEAACEGISEFASQRNISASMVAYRLYRNRSITKNQWQEITDYFLERWHNQRSAKKQAAKDRTNGPDYFRVRRHRIGNALINTVSSMMNAGTLSTTKAGRVLGIKPQQISQLLEVHRNG